MPSEEPTKTDLLVRRLKDHKAVAILLVAFAVLVGVSQAFDIAERAWTLLAPWSKSQSTQSCVFLIFEYVDDRAVDSLSVEVEVDGSRFRPAFSQRLGDLVAVVDDVKPGETFKVAFSTYQTDELTSRAESNFTVDLSSPYHSVTRRLVTPTTYTLDVSPVGVEYFRRFVSRADFAATPQCSRIPGVRWWGETSQPARS